MAPAVPLSPFDAVLIESHPMRRWHIGAVIFDLGGVLLDWDPRYVYRSYFDTSEEIDRFLANINFAEWNMQQDRGRPFLEGVADLSLQHPQYAPLIRAYYEQWDRCIAGPIPGTVEIARALKALGYAVYVLTNCSAETFPIARDRYPFLDLFDGILVSGEVGLVKPDRRIFDSMLHRIGRRAAQCLLIDDAPLNIAAAQALGFRTILFHSADLLGMQLQQMGLLSSDWRAT